MELPISLLLLAAVGIAASKLTTEKSTAASQTSKRELLEGNFGQRTTAFLNKYEPPKSTPGIHYNENLKQTLQEQSAAEQIFGARILPITKISDLLTGQGPSFDVALANHLYSPVSVYNTRFQQPASKVFPNVKIFNQQKQSSQQNNQKFQEDHTKKSLGQNPKFHLPGLLGPEFYTQESRYPPKLTKYVSATPDPRLFLYRQQSNINPFIPVQYYEQPPVAQFAHEDPGFDYVNQEAGRENKEQSLRQVEPTPIPRTLERPSINIQGYNAHPNGAVSYASFLHNNQALIDAQSDSQILYKQPFKFEQQAINRELLGQELLHVPEPPSSKPLSQESKFTSSEPQEQYIQQQFSHGPFKSGVRLKSPGPQFTSNPQRKHHTFYLHPIRNPYIKLGPSLQYLENQQPAFQALPNTGSKLEFLGQTTNYPQESREQVAPLKLLPESKQTAPQTQPNTEGSIHSQQQDPPIPGTVTYQQYVTPLYTSPETLESQATNTPKSQLSNDLAVQPTTVQPETISDSPRDIKENYLSQESSPQQVPQPTLQSLLVAPVSLQSLSTLQPSEYYSSSTPQPTNIQPQQARIQITPHHQVQIQQQELHEIHSALAPEGQDEPQQQAKKISEHEHQPLETTSQQYQSTTPQPSEPPKSDYEIEIASHVDHSQLPKDLQPVTGANVTNELVENHQLQEQQSFAHVEQNQTRVDQIQPHASLLQSFGEPPSYQNINYHDPNSLFLDPSLAQAQPIVHPQLYPEIPSFLLQPHIQQSHIPTFPPVQYFGKYAESIFGRF